MKILHTSDWHLGRSLESISRLPEQREFIDKLVEICDRENIDLVIIAGDIFDTYNPSAKAEELFYFAIESLNKNGTRAIMVIAGNHDNPDRLCAANPLAIKDGIILMGYPGEDMSQYIMDTPKIKIVDGAEGWIELSIASCEQNVIIISLPYPSESRLNEVISKSCEENSLQKAYSDRVGRYMTDICHKFRKDTVNIGVSHLFLLGGKESDSERTLSVGGAYTVNATQLPENAHYIALGHLHRPQRIKSSPSPTYYSGSPLAYSFSESEYAKSVYIIDANPEEEATVKEILLDCGKPLRRWKANSIEEAITWSKEGKDINAWVDAEILTDRILTNDEQQELRRLHSGIINIRPVLKELKDESNIAAESREGRKIEDLFKDYYKIKNGCEISQELIDTLVEILYEEEELEQVINLFGGDVE